MNRRENLDANNNKYLRALAGSIAYFIVFLTLIRRDNSAINILFWLFETKIIIKGEHKGACSNARE